MRATTNIVFVLGVLFNCLTYGQALTPDSLIARLVPTNEVPKKLLSSRSVAFYHGDFSSSELAEIQMAFKYTGIDTEAYFDFNKVLAGFDFQYSISKHLTDRKTQFLVILVKNEKGYGLYFTRLLRTIQFLDNGQTAWYKTNQHLKPLLTEVFQEALASQKKLNHLINEAVETDVGINLFTGERNEKFTRTVLTQRVAIPHWENKEADKELEAFFEKSSWKYYFVNPYLSDDELRSKGFILVLRFAYGKEKTIRELLGYSSEVASDSIAGVSNEAENPQIVTLPANDIVYKFYFKHLDFNDIFLGTEWDAARTWQEALQNHVNAVEDAFRIH